MDDAFRWDPNYSVKIAEFDRQHQQLFRTLAELDRSIRTGSADLVAGSCSEDRQGIQRLSECQGHLLTYSSA